MAATKQWLLGIKKDAYAGHGVSAADTLKLLALIERQLSDVQTHYDAWQQAEAALTMSRTQNIALSHTAMRAEQAEAALAQYQEWRQEDADNLNHCIRAKQQAEAALATQRPVAA